MKFFKLFLINLIILSFFANFPLLAQPNKGIHIKNQFSELDSLAVLIEGLSPDALNANISKEELQAIVELKLRQSGITLRQANTFGAYLDDALKGKFKKSISEDPFIYVNLSVFKPNPKSESAFYHLNTSLRMTLKRLNLDSTIIAAAWEKGVSGLTPIKELKTTVKNELDEQLTFFLNEYLKANPLER